MGKVTRSGNTLSSPAKKTTPVKKYKGRFKRQQMVTHTNLNPRKLATQGEVMTFILSRTHKSSFPKLRRSEAILQLHKSLVGSKESPGSWLKSQCSPGSKPHFLKKLEKLEKLYHKTKIRNKQKVVWRLESVKLFDLFTNPNEGEFFDAEFYENQKNGPRDLEISNQLTKEYVDIVQDTVEDKERATAKVLRETGDGFKSVTFEDPNDTPEKDDYDDQYFAASSDLSEVSKQLDFTLPKRSRCKTRRSKSEIDPYLSKSFETNQLHLFNTRNSTKNHKKCDKCDQLLPQFRKSVHTQTPGVNSWQKDQDVKDFSPWPQLNLRFPKTKKIYKSARSFVPEVIETIVDIHTGNQVGIKSSIDIFRKVSKLYGQVFYLPKELRVVKGLQLDPLKKRKKRARYSRAGKSLSGKKFKPQTVVSDTESEDEHEDVEATIGVDSLDENQNFLEPEETEIFFKAVQEEPQPEE